MSDLKVQRRLAIAAVLAMAFAGGYAISNQRAEVRAKPEPAVAVQATDSTGPSETLAAAPGAAPPRANGLEVRTPFVSGAEPAVRAARSESSEIGPPARWLPAERVTVPQSTRIVLQLAHAVSSQSWLAGDEVQAELAEPILVGGIVAVPAGVRVEGRVTEAQPLGAIGGAAALEIRFERLMTPAGVAEIDALFRRQGRSETGHDAATIAAGTAIGTVLGNQTRRAERGRLVGAFIGAAAGTMVAAKTKGELIELPAGVRLELTLRDDAEVLAPIG